MHSRAWSTASTYSQTGSLGEAWYSAASCSVFSGRRDFRNSIVSVLQFSLVQFTAAAADAENTSVLISPVTARSWFPTRLSSQRWETSFVHSSGWAPYPTTSPRHQRRSIPASSIAASTASSAGRLLWMSVRMATRISLRARHEGPRTRGRIVGRWPDPGARDGLSPQANRDGSASAPPPWRPWSSRSSPPGRFGRATSSIPCPSRRAHSSRPISSRRRGTSPPASA